MNAQDLVTCRDQAALARENVRAFYQACVPQNRRGLFMDYALKECPEQMVEIESLKLMMAQSPKCVSSYVTACNRWSYLSKEVVRRVSFVLARKVLP